MPVSPSARPRRTASAAQYAISRAACTWVPSSPSLSWIAWKSEIGWPNALRCLAYDSASSCARWAMPTERAAMLTRPHSSADSTCCMPRPSTPPTRFATGTRTSVERDLAGLGALVAELRDVLGDLVAGGVRLDQQHAHALVRGRRARVGLAPAPAAGRVAGVGDPHLRAVDDVVVAIEPGGGADALQVGPGVRLGEADAAAPLAGGEIGKVAAASAPRCRASRSAGTRASGCRGCPRRPSSRARSPRRPARTTPGRGRGRRTPPAR